ncbi:MAG TPA: hypothetical protein V6C85_39055 [Allocoleopsis sp.]
MSQELENLRVTATIAITELHITAMIPKATPESLERRAESFRMRGTPGALKIAQDLEKRADNLRRAGS